MARSTSSRVCGPSGRPAASGSSSTSSRMRGSCDETGLDDLGEAADVVGARHRDEGRQVAEDPGGRVEGADEVLALGDVDGGLAADRGVDHAEQRGGHQHGAYAAQPGRGGEPGQVGGGSPADADDRVRTGHAEPREARPEPGEHGGVLARLAVGHRQRMHFVPGVGEHPAHRPGDRGQPLGVHDRDGRGAADQARQLAEDAGADHDVVRAVAADRDTAHGRSFRISSTMSAGSRPSVVTLVAARPS